MNERGDTTIDYTGIKELKENIVNNYMPTN